MADDDLSWLTDDEKTALTALLKLMPSLTRVIRVSLMAMCLFIKGAQAQGVGATATAQMLYGMCSTTASDFCNGVFAGWWSVLSVLTVPPALILRSPYSSASRPESRRFILHQVIPQVIEGGRAPEEDGRVTVAGSARPDLVGEGLCNEKRRGKKFQNLYLFSKQRPMSSLAATYPQHSQHARVSAAFRGLVVAMSQPWFDARRPRSLWLGRPPVGSNSRS